MKPALLFAATLLSLAPGSWAKDEIITIADCPDPVRRAIAKYEAAATVQEIGRDHKKKSGGPTVYEVKMLQKDGRLVEITFGADGTILKTEEKKAKP